MVYDLSRRNKTIIVKKEEVTVEKEKLREQLNDLLDEYNSLQSNNDSLNSEIQKDKERIRLLIEELDKAKNFSYQMQKKYEQEMASLRKIMRHYVYQIDSLNQLNQQLISENVQIKREHNRIKNEFDEVVTKNDELELVIEGASVVKTSHITIKFLNRRGKETERSSRVEKIQTSFTLVANDLAKAGPRRVYLRIISPDGYVLSSGQTFTYREREISYSAARDIIYEKQNLDVVIFYDVTGELIKGKYTVEIYMDGHKIGESFFTIEK
jgi:chromosome segregation ATPase